jgi:hypothetical protein
MALRRMVRGFWQCDMPGRQDTAERHHASAREEGSGEDAMADRRRLAPDERGHNQAG